MPAPPFRCDYQGSLQSGPLARRPRVIDVRLFAHLPAASSAGTAEFQVEAREGLTVRNVVTDAGIPVEAVYIVMLNNVRTDLDASLADGDRLALFPAVSGG
jgi:molybdopterin converting factor small subunit